MSKKRRRNPLGDLAHFNPFGSRIESKNFRRNVDAERRALERKALTGDEDAKEKLDRLEKRVGLKKRPDLWTEVGKHVARSGTRARQRIAKQERELKEKQKRETRAKRRAERAVVPIRSRKPIKSYGCEARPVHQFRDPCFESVKEARAYLEFKVPEMTPEECAENANRIKQAERVVARANKRNLKRKLRRSGQAPVARPKSGVAAPAPAQTLPKKPVIHYEELTGPEGETVRFRLTYENGKFQKRVRVREEPPIGSIILDLTCGVKAWKRFSDKRRSIPLTNEMKKSYENSFLHKVRQFGAGKISFQQLADKIAAAKKAQRGAKGSALKKLRRKNRKNR